ncbi:hypothetical protein M6B38_181095 [Iris pallida]|uniref:Uncharacterized protein n=1 Tax=Iris pallida TaxID=29817 RepID=A0AAX6EMV1_IRIPA|nr:hypothetical protein M6B38_181095 [Iris pallida]
MSRKDCTKENFYKGKILSLQPAATMCLQISAAATMRLQIGAASPCATSEAQQILCASIQAHPAISSAAQLCASSPAMCIPSAKFFQPGSPGRAEPSYAPLFQPGSPDSASTKYLTLWLEPRKRRAPQMLWTGEASKEPPKAKEDRDRNRG